MGGAEAVSNAFEMGVFKDYDYVIHLHPDVFFVDESGILDLLTSNAENDYVFFVNKSRPDDDRFFSFDFFVFKPRLLRRNIFLDELHDWRDIPEYYLHDMIAKNDVKFKLVKRFENDSWAPRRVDEHLHLYHEHDLPLVEDLLKSLTKADKPSVADAGKWRPPVVELLARPLKAVALDRAPGIPGNERRR